MVLQHPGREDARMLVRRSQVAHRLELSEEEQPVAHLEHPRDLRIRDDGRSPVQREDDDVALAKTRLLDRTSHQVRTLGELQLRDPVTGAHGQPLSDVELRGAHLVGDEVDDRARHVEPRRRLDPLETRRRVDLHDLRAVGALEHVDARDLQAHDPGRTHGGLLEEGVERDRLGNAAPVHVAPVLAGLGDPSHRGDHAVSEHDRADVAPRALAHELLDQDVLLRALQRLDDRFGDLHGVGEDHADALCALEQLDDHRRAADPLDRGKHVLLPPHEGRVRHPDVVPTQDLERPQLVARVGDGVRRTRRVDVELLELPDDGGAEVGDRRADAGDHRVVATQPLGAEEELRAAALDLDREAQGVEDLHRVAALERRLPEASRAVRVPRAREDRKLHRSTGPTQKGAPSSHLLCVRRMRWPSLLGV